MCAGNDEILVDSITICVQMIECDMGKENVLFEVEKGEIYVCERLESMVDEGKKVFLEGEGGDKRAFEETEETGEMIADKIRVRSDANYDSKASV